MSRLRWCAVGLAGVLLTLHGCSDTAGQTSGEGESRDCVTAIRFRRVTYTEIGVTDQRGSRVGRGRVRACNDTNQVASGPAFPDDAVRRTLRRLPGFSVGSVVVGPRYTDNSHVVLTSSDLSLGDRRRLDAFLGGP